jgi:hypothetical protein
LRYTNWLARTAGFGCAAAAAAILASSRAAAGEAPGVFPGSEAFPGSEGVPGQQGQPGGDQSRSRGGRDDDPSRAAAAQYGPRRTTLDRCEERALGPVR